MGILAVHLPNDDYVSERKQGAKVVRFYLSPISAYAGNNRGSR